MVEYHPDHLEKIDLKDCHQGENPWVVKTEAITYLNGDRPIAIFGWFLLLPGVLQVWGLVSTSAYEHKLKFHKASLEVLQKGMNEFGVKRVQMSVKVGFDEGWRWAKALGFSCEGTMKNYGPDGSDYWLFARVK